MNQNERNGKGVLSVLCGCGYEGIVMIDPTEDACAKCKECGEMIYILQCKKCGERGLACSQSYKYFSGDVVNRTFICDECRAKNQIPEGVESKIIPTYYQDDPKMPDEAKTLLDVSYKKSTPGLLLFIAFALIVLFFFGSAAYRFILYPIIKAIFKI